MGGSAWEIGTGQNATDKATRDFKNRTRNPLGVDPAETTYVAATLRHWPQKDRWVARRRERGPWKNVIAIDADDLETWLRAAPAVHAWVSIQLGKPVGGAQDLLSFWDAWTASTVPAVSRDMVIGGRDKPQAEVVAWLDHGDRSTLAIKGATPEESLAFLVASILGLPPETRDSILARALLIRDPAAWTWATAFAEPLLLVPLWADRMDIGDAVRAGHRVVAPVGAAAPLSETVELGKPLVEPIVRGLEGAGLPQERARRLGRIGRRSLQAMRRQIALRPELQCPDWSTDPDVSDLIAGGLAGGWDETVAGDRQVLERLAGRSWVEVERSLVRRAVQPDAAFQRVGRTWLLASKEDWWSLLSSRVTVDGLHAFGDVALEVLGARNPALDLPPSDQWMANVLGHERPHSSALRAGLADTLAFFGTLETSSRPIDSAAHDTAGYSIRRLLRAANEDETGSLWLSLSDVLTLIAEAAPEEFLEGVEQGPLETPALLDALVGEAPGPFASGGRHDALVHALETVAWSADYLGRSSVALAKLARSHPSEPRANSPYQSLRTTFLSLHPQTAASSEARLEVLDHLREHEPDVAWNVMVESLPSRREIVFPRPAPARREWAPDSHRTLSRAEVTREQELVVQRLLVDVNAHPMRWADLVRVLSRMPQTSLELVTARLDVLDESDLGDAALAAIRNEVRRLLGRYGDALSDSSHPGNEILKRLQSVYNRLVPHDPVMKTLWLFSRAPRVLEVDEVDFDAHAAAVEKARRAAVAEIAADGGIDAVMRLIDAADAASDVGRLTASIPSGLESAVVRLIGAPGNRGLAAAAYVRARFEDGGWSWADGALRGSPLTTAELAAFLAALPARTAVWDRVAALGSNVEAAYWRIVSAWGIREASEVARAARSLTQHGRGWDAVEALAYAYHAGFFDSDLTVSVLQEAAAQEPPDGVRLHTLDWWIAKLFDALEEAGAPDQVLGHLEWIYLPVLEDHRPPRSLHAALSSDPSFFVELVCLNYRASDDESSPTDERRSRAAAAHRLLDSWRTPPGLGTDGDVDEKVMLDWVERSRALLAERKRADIGDQVIGKILRHAPTGQDGLWPHEAVRRVLERFAAPHIQKGIRIEVLNTRGVTERQLFEGGVQERALAQSFADGAQRLRTSAPRTATLLRALARDYARDATREDHDAELMEDRWG